MRPVPPYIVHSLEKNAPLFLKAVAQSGDVIILPWALMDEDPVLLYNCVWLALCCGKRVIIEPPI